MVHAGKGGGRMFVNAARIHGRKSNFSLLEYMQSEVRAYESPVPAWMPACLLAPPMTIPNVPHPGKLTYPEDALRKVWFDRHPEARKIKLKTVYVGEHRYWQHPATSFVSRQIKLINKGIDEQEAYTIVEEEDKQEARYRELERIVAIEQAKELGFEDLETARDLLAPPDLTQARERMLEELIEVVKLKGIPNVVPELLPKGMKWREVLAFVHKFPQYAHYFSLDFMATHAITSGNPEIADAFMWIYGGEEITDEPSPEELEEIEAFVDSAYGISGDAGDDDDDGEEDSAYDTDTIENAARGFAAELIGGTLEDEEGFFEEDDREGSRGDEEGDEPEAGEKFGEDQMSPEEQAAEAAEEAERIASIEEDGRKFQAIMARIERVYRPEQYPPANDTAWANLVSLLALRPKAPNVKLAKQAEDMVKAEKAKRAARKAKRSTGGAKSKGKEVELQ